MAIYLDELVNSSAFFRSNMSVSLDTMNGFGYGTILSSKQILKLIVNSVLSCGNWAVLEQSRP